MTYSMDCERKFKEKSTYKARFKVVRAFKGGLKMLFMLLVKASKNSEEGKLPSEALMEAMSRYNEALAAAGVRIMAKGLHPSSNGLRISFTSEGEAPVVTEGPFENTGDIVAGFILIEVNSKEEAIKWAMQMPDPQGFGEGQIELRQVF